MPKPARLIPLAIVAFWLVMMGWFLYREIGVGAPASTRSVRLGPSDTWLTVYLAGEQPAGYIHIQETPEPRNDVPGIRTNIRATAKLILLGRLTPAFANGLAWTSLDGDTAYFDFSLRSGDHKFRIEGDMADGRLKGQVHTAGEAIPVSFPVGEDFSLLPDLALPDLEVGETYTLDTFDPLTLSNTPTKLACIGQEVLRVMGEDIEARIVTLTSNTLQAKAWIGPDAEILRAETPFGFTLERTTAEAALAIAQLDAAPPTEDFLSLSAIQPTGRQPVRGAQSMVVRMSGVAEGIQPETDDTQRQIEANVYEIVVPEEIPRNTDAPSADMAEYLASSPFVQSDHDEIRAMAAEIVGGLDTVPEQAQALYEWVYTQIDKVATFSVPSALEVLATREGDCNEHTVLYVALARSLGIPSRIAVGIVWSDEYNGFYYHAWPEVYSGGRWTWIDPTLGQPIADATHIKLLSGEIQRWTELIPYMSRLRIQVLESEPGDLAP